VRGSTARLCAGNGIVADSDPPTELAETQAKLQAILSTLTRV
jgi:isochorismate synthase EntC